MAKTLKEFQTSFGTDAVEVEIQFGKEAAFYIHLRPLTSAAKDKFEASIVGTEGKRNLENLRARLVASCWVDEEGNKLGSAEEIGALRADLVGAIFDKVRSLNGMDADDVAEAGND